MMYPNTNFLKYFPDTELPEIKDTACRSGCLRIGAFLVLRRIIAEYHLDEIIGRLIGRDSGLFLDLIAYSIIAENNAGQYYPDYAYNHPLFTKGMKIYSDSKVSDFINSITRDQSIAFQNEWNQSRDHREKIYISYDSTNKNCQAGDIDFVEYGHAKDDKGLPVLNYSIAYDHNNSEPLFYEEYPGSIVDISQLQLMLEKANGYGYKHVGFILDRGYFSKENIRYMDKCGYEFVIMMKGMKELVKSLVLEVKGTFEENRAYSIRDYKVSGITVKRQLYPSDGKERYCYEDALEEITTMSSHKRMVFVIDEYPYLAKAEKSFSSRLQHIIDHQWQDGQLYLILCGSSKSFMEYQVLGYESPLYGHQTAQFKIQALPYREITACYPDLSTEDQALLYGVTGGIPHYINKLDVEKNLDEALLENLFNISSYLFEEPENLLKQELREPAIYNSVIAAIAGGASRSNEISTKVGLESGVCAKYLKVLLDLGLLKKETPITEKPGKKTVYGIDDNFFRFWYRFVPRNMSLISAGRMQQVYEQAVKRYYPDYMGLVFEKMCREYLLRYASNLPVLLSNVGQWWGTDAKTRKEIQIDIVGTPVEGNEYLIGSCKYRNEKTGIGELELIRRYASVFRKNGTFHYYIFSRGGFTQELIMAATCGLCRLS